MKYFGGCDVGSTYTKAVILDETGKIVADTTLRSKINSEVSATLAMEEVCKKAGLNDSKDLAYLIGTGYGRNKVPFADENISEISCQYRALHFHSMNNRKKIRNLFESSAHKVKVEGYTRKPYGKIGQQRTAYAAYLLFR